MTTQAMITPPVAPPCVSVIAMREPPGVVYQDRALGSVLSVGPEHRLRGNDPLHGVRAGGALGEQAAGRFDLVDGAAGVEGLGAHRLAGREPRAVAGGDGPAPHW